MNTTKETKDKLKSSHTFLEMSVKDSLGVQNTFYIIKKKKTELRDLLQCDDINEAMLYGADYMSKIDIYNIFFKRKEILILCYTCTSYLKACSYIKEHMKLAMQCKFLYRICEECSTILFEVDCSTCETCTRKQLGALNLRLNYKGVFNV
jgi:hypothetical protein